MDNGQLILHPDDPAYSTAPATLSKALAETGFIGDAFGKPEEQRFLAGERFLQLITFMGCSPHIELEPQPDGSLNFCHIRIHGPLDQPLVLWGRNTTAPRCPACRKRITDWRGRIGEWERLAEAPFPCPHCHEAIAPVHLDWRRQAGSGRIFVAVQQVFPGEAVPVPELMETLAHVSHGEWGHFYLLQENDD